MTKENKQLGWLMGVSLAIIGVAWVGEWTGVTSQVLGDGYFRAITIGEGAAGDITLTYDDGTARTIRWNDAEGQFEISERATVAGDLDVDGGDLNVTGAAPTFGFYDTDFSSAASGGSFVVNFSDLTSSSEDSAFIISHYKAGDFNQWLKVQGTANANPSLAVYVDSINAMSIGYTGLNGSRYGFVSGPMAGLAVASAGKDLYVTGTSSTITLTSPDGTCSRCSVDNSDVFTCTTVTCPTVAP